MMKILGIDPGYGRLGWSILEGNRSKQQLLAYGCIETKPKQELDKRLMVIHHQLNQIIDDHQPKACAVEALYFFKNQKTVMGVGQARGVVVLTANLKGLNCSHYTPLQIKNVVAGYGKASKHQVQTMVKSQLKLKSIPKPDDAADACAVALTHIFYGY